MDNVSQKYYYFCLDCEKENRGKSYNVSSYLQYGNNNNNMRFIQVMMKSAAQDIL